VSNPQWQPTSDIPRREPDRLAGDWDSLQQWLDYHRATLLLKCHGLTDEQLRRRPLPMTSLSLLGLLRHLTEVERSWFGRTLAGEDDPPLYYSDADPDGDFDRLDSHPVVEVRARYAAAVARSREVLAGFDHADERARSTSRSPVTVRWVMLHLVEEYARHNGHADLLRQAVDGAVGE
jgi:uncharacterized damage-inducible protein DinB